MNHPEEFEFVVGGTYENEKGLFAVLSMGKEEMVIRWEDGEETRTSIALQARIQKRRQWEKAQRQKQAEVPQPAPKKARASRRHRENPPPGKQKGPIE